MIVFNIERTKELLQDFYNVTGIKICVFDCDGIEIAYYPKKHIPFCEYVSSTPGGAKICACSVKHALEQCRKEKCRILYTCNMGLIECVTPIMLNDTVMGYVMLGQTRSRRFSDYEHLKDLARSCGLDLSELCNKFDRIAYNSYRKIESASKIMEACASFICTHGIMKIDEDDLQMRMDKYISEHIDSKLSITGLCNTFGLSRSAIYKFFHKVYGTSVLEYIFQKRIRLACELLETTEKSIADIATTVGMDNYNYFIRAFSKAKGISPLKYRKANKF